MKFTVRDNEENKETIIELEIISDPAGHTNIYGIDNTGTRRVICQFYDGKIELMPHTDLKGLKTDLAGRILIRN